MLIRNSEVKKLSDDIRKIIDGQTVDLCDNREGVWSILKNDIHTLATLKSEQVDALGCERDVMKDTLTNISHQLKTPLTSMMIMADLLETAPSNKQSEFLINIKVCLTRLWWLSSALLKIAKLDAGAVEFSKDIVQSDILINHAIEPLQTLFDLKNHRVEISGEAKLLCDKHWTAEAVTNVVKNASEYSPDGGKILIESGMNPICSWIAITDSGEGITNTTIANLFKRFSGSRSDHGYGIGLPLALAIMQSQNGDIEVEGGGNGSGATFTLKFYK